MHRSLLTFSKNLFVSFTIEKIEISSFEKRVLKNSGPRIEPWGTSDFIGFHSEVWPFNNNFLNRLSK